MPADTGAATGLFRTYHAKALYDQFSNDRLFIGIGRTTAWDNDGNDNPETDPAFDSPAENAAANSLEEPIGFQLCDVSHFLTEDEAGDFDFGGTLYRIIDYADTRTEKPQFLYIQATFLGDELPLSTFRQSALLGDLVRETGVSSSINSLLPSQVLDAGWLLLLDNFAPRTRSSSQKDVVSFLIAL